ncbi:MAG: NUDIX domain-containing protein [Caldilineaceae bacterium]|nr:NUDIX domain-containing protein [Caldilineaceae bacterium]
MAFHHYKAAGGVVIQQGIIDGLDAAQNYVLVLDRPGRNEVRLPKGHIDPGENPQETAVRETQEETGFVDLLVLADLGERQVEFDYRDKHYIRDEHYFLMKLTSPRRIKRPAQDEAQFRPRWSRLGEAAAALTYTAEQQVVAAAVEKYLSQGK